MQNSILFFMLWFMVASVVVYLSQRYFDRKQRRINEDMILQAQRKTQEMYEKAEKDIREQKKELNEEIKKEKEGVRDTQNRLEKREERLDERIGDLEKKEKDLEEKKKEFKKSQEKLEEKQEELFQKLQEVSNLDVEDAKNLLFNQIEDRYERDFLSCIEKKKKELLLREQDISKEILVNAMQQYTASVTSEVTQSVVDLASDDMKGRIIGKEGRNILAFEKETGVSLIIDDTPNTVFISSFDLFRRYIAKKSIEQLMEDKRIQPARIEEVVAQNRADAEKLIYGIGERTLSEMGISGWPDEIVSIIGKLRFRTSYGQNILKHSQEVAYIAEGIAKQIGADTEICLQGGILHDLGKALDHDIEGTHPEIGGKVLRKYNFNEKLINITEGHHGDVLATCIETQVIMLADAISAVRPGARRANMEQYVKRLKEMEELVSGFSGVEKAYALSAGREVRVFVDVKKISDLDAEKMAQDIAVSIEANLNYPGEVKVTLIRENRFIQYAR